MAKRIRDERVGYCFKRFRGYERKTNGNWQQAALFIDCPKAMESVGRYAANKKKWHSLGNPLIVEKQCSFV